MVTDATRDVSSKSHLQRYFFEVGIPQRLPLQGLLHRDTEERLGRVSEDAVSIPPGAPADSVQMPCLIHIAVSATKREGEEEVRWGAPQSPSAPPRLTVCPGAPLPVLPSPLRAPEGALRFRPT